MERDFSFPGSPGKGTGSKENKIGKRDKEH
jgi:hypothetical protein